MADVDVSHLIDLDTSAADIDVSHLIDLDTSVAPGVPPPLLPPPSAGTSPQSRLPSPLLPLSPLRPLGSNDDPFEKVLRKSFDYQDPFETTFDLAQKFTVKEVSASVIPDLLDFRKQPSCVTGPLLDDIPQLTVSPSDEPERLSLSPRCLHFQEPEADVTSRGDPNPFRSFTEWKPEDFRRLVECIEKRRRLSEPLSARPRSQGLIPPRQAKPRKSFDEPSSLILHERLFLPSDYSSFRQGINDIEAEIMARYEVKHITQITSSPHCQ